MFPAVQTARVHRFGDALALSFVALDASGRPVPLPTVYVPAALVEALRMQAGRFLDDYTRNPFGPGSTFGTHTHDKEGRSIEK